MPPTLFADRLFDNMRRRQSRLIVGLDPVWDKLPLALRERAADRGQDTADAETQVRALREFCEAIIGATREFAAAFKPQVAFFERYGSLGMQALEQLLRGHRDLLFIADCKRGDIGTTSEAYARAYFNLPGEPAAPLSVDAVTLNAYLGRDALAPFEPFISQDRGAFLLAKTSNPSSADFQDRMLEGEPLYLQVARRIAQWGEDYIGGCGYSSIGMVVGATFPAAARLVREAAPHSIFLVPGIGMQGGQVADAPAFCAADGSGALFNFSRGVIYAYRAEPYKTTYGDGGYAAAAGAAADLYRRQLNDALGEIR